MIDYITHLKRAKVRHEPMSVCRYDSGQALMLLFDGDIMSRDGDPFTLFRYRDECGVLASDPRTAAGAWVPAASFLMAPHDDFFVATWDGAQRVLARLALITGYPVNL